MIENSFNTSLLQIDKSLRQKLKREILELNKIIVQKDLTDIYKTFYANTKEHILFSVVYDTLKKERDKGLNSIRDEREHITTDTKEIQ